MTAMTELRQTVYQRCRELEVPEDYFQGRRLPESFALPNSILAFFPRWGQANEQCHARHVLVIPFTPVTYCVDQARFELTPGIGILLRPWQHHHHLSANERQPCERLLITFDLPAPQPYLPQSQTVDIHDAAWHEIQRFLGLYRQGATPELSWQLYRLLLCLSQRTEAVARQELSDVIVRSISFILKHIHHPLTIHRIAAKVNISPSHLRMMFRKEMHISIGKYINMQRSQKACHLLRHTLLPIQEVAEQCGYDSIYAFSHFFKNAMGLSPLNFRKAEEPPKPEAD